MSYLIPDKNYAIVKKIILTKFQRRNIGKSAVRDACSELQGAYIGSIIALYIRYIYTLLIVHYIKKARYFLIAIQIYLSRKILEVHTACLHEECTFLLHIYVIKVCTLSINIKHPVICLLCIYSCGQKGLDTPEPLK